MRYNQKYIYQNYGQFDNVVTINISKNTEDYLKYGKSLTGQIRYKKDERELLQKSLTEEVNLDNFNKLKIDDNISKLKTNDKFNLYYDGINIASIESIFSIPFSTVNVYADKELRKIPEPIPIKFNSRNFDAPRAFIWLNDRRKKDGYLLTDFEEKENIAYHIIANNSV